MTDCQEPEAGRFQAGKVMVRSFSHCIHEVYLSSLTPRLPILIDLGQVGFLAPRLQVPARITPYPGLLADRVGNGMFIVSAPALTVVAMSALDRVPSHGVLLVQLFAAVSVLRLVCAY